MNDEEEKLLSSIPHIRRKNFSLIQYRSNSFFQFVPFSREGTHTLYTSLRLSWFAETIMRKIVSSVSWSTAQCIDSSPRPLLLNWPLYNGIVARKIGHPLSANSNNILSAILSQIPCGLSSLIEDHFFSEPGPMNDHCPFPNLLVNRDTSRAFVRHSSSLSLVPQEMSLNIDINRILPVKCSGVSPNLYSKTFNFIAEVQRIESWKNNPLEFHDSPSILSNFL